MTRAIYNEIEPFAADWLDNLIAGGHVASGTVDRRSIADLTPADVAGPGQRHFFAGIGGWSYALRLAGISDDDDIWTGSCPCQGLSDAGKRLGARDPRHLWPAWFALIRECRPPTIFGEQVASRLGLDWLDLVRSDLEGCGYAVGASDLCAAGVGAPNIRQRLYFVAYARGQRRQGQRVRVQPGEPRPSGVETGGGSEAGRRLPLATGRGGRAGQLSTTIEFVGHAGIDRTGQHPGELPRDEAQHEVRREDRDHASVPAGATRGFWHPADWIPCLDGVQRPVEPGTFPLAPRVPNRVGRLRAYGNAIVPQLAAAFVACAERALTDLDLATGTEDE